MKAIIPMLSSRWVLYVQYTDEVASAAAASAATERRRATRRTVMKKKVTPMAPITMRVTRIASISLCHPSERETRTAPTDVGQSRAYLGLTGTSGRCCGAGNVGPPTG